MSSEDRLNSCKNFLNASTTSFVPFSRIELAFVLIIILESTGIPFSENVIKRLKYTVSQAQSPSLEQRQCNVINAFACTQDSLSGVKVLLLDDVTTSGATFNACASVLKEKGAESVNCLTIAKEI